MSSQAATWPQEFGNSVTPINNAPPISDPPYHRRPRHRRGFRKRRGSWPSEEGCSEVKGWRRRRRRRHRQGRSRGETSPYPPPRTRVCECARGGAAQEPSALEPKMASVIINYHATPGSGSRLGNFRKRRRARAASRITMAARHHLAKYKRVSRFQVM